MRLPKSDLLTLNGQNYEEMETSATLKRKLKLWYVTLHRKSPCMSNSWRIKLTASLCSKLMLKRSNAEQKSVPPATLEKNSPF